VEEDTALWALRRQARANVVHELAGVWSIFTHGLQNLQACAIDPVHVEVLEDMRSAEMRGRALFETLRRLL
jgi:hypothetical protein